MDSRRRHVLVLLTTAILARLTTALLIQNPGYMDAAYYAAGAVRLAEGGGFREPFVWNYLTNAMGTPHPGFLYWMPLPSLLAAPFAAAFPDSFFALQVPFVILSALVPLVAFLLAREATGSKRWAWVAGLLAVFSGFFFPYWTLPETFAPFALCGSLALWLAGRGEGTKGTHWLSVGLLVGLAHLTRADGILLLPIVALGALLPGRSPDAPDGKEEPPRDTSSGSYVAVSASRFGLHISRVTLRRVPLVLLGYLLVMAPWFARNVAVIGAPLSPAGTKTMWLTNYDDLFCYDCDLSLSSYLAWGWDNILRSKLSALWINAQRFVAEGCLIFLLPFILLGFKRLRRQLSFVLAACYLVGTYLFHSLIFTFPGWRGGFFHATSAALPFLYAAAASGLDLAVRWAAQRRRSWRLRQAQSVFAVSAVLGAVTLSGYTAWKTIPAWNKANALYEDVDQWLTRQGTSTAAVMVGDPPSFWYHTRRPAAVIPNGDADTLLEVADRYDMEYVLLEEDHPAPLNPLHAGEERHPRLQTVETWAGGGVILCAVRQ